MCGLFFGGKNIFIFAREKRKHFVVDGSEKQGVSLVSSTTRVDFECGSLYWHWRFVL